MTYPRSCQGKVTAVLRALLTPTVRHYLWTSCQREVIGSLRSLPKARWRNEVASKRGEAAPIPVNSINKEPSAELRPDQKDSDSLPDYKVLDQILEIYIDQDGGKPAALAAGFDAALVDKVVALVDRAEYKRRQYPPGTKISNRAFGKDRRLPITSHWNES